MGRQAPENESNAKKDAKMNLNQGSAKIYQFPVGGRGGRHDESSRSAVDRAPQPVSETACSDSWYHEAAIQDSKRER
jgi:hypothetical protein